MATDRTHRRKPLRLQGYDYAQAGAYFVTICTHQRAHLFGGISDGIMQLSPFGQIAAICWHAIPTHYPGVELDAFVVMPNHTHAIVILPGGGAALGTIVGTYKAAVTRQAHRAIEHTALLIWQSLYYDRIIRDDAALQRIREYIGYNPLCWEQDVFASKRGRAA